MKKGRSPAYPFVGLPTALERAKILFEAHQQNSASRETVAHGLGFNRLHGQSRRYIATLVQYGFLEKVDDELRISELAMTCLFADTEEEKAEALGQAASSPKVFHDLQKKYPTVPTEEMGTNWLIRNGFSRDGAKCAAKAYRETMLFVERLPIVGAAEVEAAPSQEEIDTATPTTEHRVNSYASSQGLEPGRFLTTTDENSLVDVVAVKLDQELLARLRDRLNHLLGENSELSDPPMLEHDD